MIRRRYRFNKDWQDRSRWSTQKRRLHAIFKGELEAGEPEEVDGEEIPVEDVEETEVPEENRLLDRLQQYADVVMTVRPDLSREQAIAWLVRDEHGRSAATHMASLIDKRQETPPMDRLTKLKKAAVDYGINSVAKHITDTGKTGVSESEFTSMVQAYASCNKLAGESDVAAFSCIFSEQSPQGTSIRQAHAITKLTPQLSIEPTFAAGKDATDVNDATEALAKLKAMAEEQSRRVGISSAKAFLQVFSDPANAELTARAHKRPAMTSVYAFPR
jgi:hypothetical protein